MSNAADSTAIPRRRAGDRAAAPSSALVTLKHAAEASDNAIDAVPLRSARHDPSFLTHLIAIAERCPQTRVLRRATPQDAMAAYRAADANGQFVPIGVTTRQNV